MKGYSVVFEYKQDGEKVLKRDRFYMSFKNRETFKDSIIGEDIEVVREDVSDKEAQSLCLEATLKNLHNLRKRRESAE